MKNIEPYYPTLNDVLSDGIIIEPSYEMKNYDHIVPTLRFSAGVEWFIFHNFAIFAEAAYTQHIMPTIIEQAAKNRGKIKSPSGAMTLSVGLSLFFN